MQGRPFLGGPGAYPVRTVGADAPLRWLALGWRDLRRCPVPALLHGLCAAAFGAAVFLLGHDRFWAMAGAFSGFLIVAPLVATGLYAVSRALERGRVGTMADVFAAWTSLDRRLVHFGFLLAFAGTGWVLVSASLVTGFAPMPVDRPVDFLRVVVLDDRNWLFEIWLMLGGFLAAPVFASSVVALPLLLDRRGERDCDVLRAVLTSWAAVGANPVPLALWAGLIMALTLAGMALALVGLVLVVPLLAHASWHAYRELVEPPADPSADRGR
jgi:uncharacterized membrane protein